MESLCIPSARHGRQETGCSIIDIKSGEVNILLEKNGETTKHKMHMKVFRNTYEHHAQIYTDSEYMFTFDFISLRNCEVMVNENSNIVRISGCKTGHRRSVTNDCFLFEAKNVSDAREWFTSLTPSKQLRRGSEFSPCPSPLPF